MSSAVTKLVVITVIAAGVATFMVYNKKALNKHGSPQVAGNRIVVEEHPVPPQYTDKNFFLTAIEQATEQRTPKRVTGITVPHHLLARDVMAAVFAASSGNPYKRILVVSPDHFSLGKTKISYATEDFDTVFGRLIADREFIGRLAQVPGASSADFFYREHGIGAELPFLKYFFPEARVVAMTLSVNAGADDVSPLLDFLKNNIGPETLLVQSTDFSHYLTAEAAEVKDKQTMDVLMKVDAGEDPALLYDLNQPDNMDCIACQYLQSRLQREFFKSTLHIVRHKNSQAYTEEKVEETTSYIPQIYY